MVQEMSLDPAADPERPDFVGNAWSWVLYDVGYSVFTTVVFARYLADWIIIDLGRPDWQYASAQVVVAALLLLAMPLAGVVADVIGRHKPLVVAFTLLSIAAAVGIGLVPDSVGVLPVFTLAIVAGASAALALSQFEPLLASVAAEPRWGAVSGTAAAIGFVAIIVVLSMFAGVIVGGGDKQQAFIPAALVFVRERQRTATPVPAREVPARALRDMRGSLRRLLEQRQVLRLIIGRLMYTDSVATIVLYLPVYISRAGGFTEARKDLALITAVGCAGIGALVASLAVPRIGPRRALLVVLPAFSIALMVLAVIGTPWTIWLLAPVLGAAIGTVYTCDRVLMLILTPRHLRGQLFGFYNLSGRVVQAFSPFVLWGGVIWLLHHRTGWLDAFDASRVSLGLIGATVLIGVAIIRPIDDGHRRRAR
jgi:MFS transporter, UMF1 family